MKNLLQTSTLVDRSENPVASLYLGHVNVTTFNRGYVKEGWKGDRIRKNEILHEYWIVGKKSCKKSTITDRKAVAVTVLYW